MAGVVATPRAQFLALFGLRRRLALRTVRGDWNAIIALIIFFVIAAPVALFFAVGTYQGYARAPDPWPAEILHWVWVVLWALWAIFPIIAGALNESLDISRLLGLPIRRSAMVSALVAGTVLDVTTWIALPAFLAMAMAWGAGLQKIFVVFALLIGWCHLVVTGQVVTTVFAGVFHSRRFRDVMLVIGTVTGLAVWASQFLLDSVKDIGAFATSSDVLDRLQLSHILQWTPTGAIARAIEQVSAGSWAGALVWLSFSIALLVPATWLWWWVLVRVTTNGGALFGGVSLARRRSTPLVDAARESRGAPGALPFMPRGVRGVLVEKELRLAWRDPLRRMALFQAILMPIVFGGYIAYGASDAPHLAAYAPAGAMLMMVLMSHQNIFGMEGAAVATLLLSPVPRTQIFHARTVASVMMFSVPTLLVAGAFAFFSGNVVGALDGLLLAASSLLVASVGVYALSVWAAFPVAQSGKRGFGRQQVTFTKGLLWGLVLPIGTAVVTAPVWATMAAGMAFHIDWLVHAAAMGGLGYGAAVYIYGLRIVAAGLQTTEPELYATLKKAD